MSIYAGWSGHLIFAYRDPIILWDTVAAGCICPANPFFHGKTLHVELTYLPLILENVNSLPCLSYYCKKKVYLTICWCVKKCWMSGKQCRPWSDWFRFLWRLIWVYCLLRSVCPSIQGFYYMSHNNVHCHWWSPLMNTQNSMTWSKLIDIQVADRVICVSLGMHGFLLCSVLSPYLVWYHFLHVITTLPWQLLWNKFVLR